MALTDRRYGVAEDQAVKSPCRAATTANITLSGEQTIDGIACVDGDRVLVKDQSTASENGIYVCSTGNWTRAKDFDGAYDVVKGTRVWVHSGSINGNLDFVVTTSDPIVIDDSNIALSSVTAILNAAPGSADYLVKTANGVLSAERVVTDTATVTWDFATAAQAKATVPAATTSASGVVELATSAETVTGTDTSRATTPAGVAATIAAVSPALPRRYGSGCTLSNNSGDATNDIDCTAGVWRDITDTANIVVSAFTGKQLDANWAVGSSAGMRYSGAGIANATYGIFAARTAASATGDIYAYPLTAGTDADTTAFHATVLAALQAESGGSSYAYIRRIGSIIRSGATILAFSQDGDEFLLKDPPQSSTTAPTTSSALYSLAVPVGLKVRAIFNVWASRSAAGLRIYFSSPDVNDEAVSSGAAPGINLGSNDSGGVSQASGQYTIRTDTSGRIRAITENSVTSFNLVTVGYFDKRGKDA